MRTAASQQWNPTLYEQNHAFVWQMGQSLLHLLNPQADERILDLGCGTGQLTAEIAATGAWALGLDASAEMIDQAKANYPALSFGVADARDFQLEDPVDAVFSNAVLHWVLEPNAVIASIGQALKPGGRFVAEFGGRGNVEAIQTALAEALDEIGYSFQSPWYFPSLSDYTTRLEEQGFEVLYAALFDRPTPLIGKMGLANWLQMFAKPVLASLSEPEQQQVIESVEARLQPLYQDDRWLADYRRIRVMAYLR
jgi:trans-aconitate methyltransferase